MHLTTCDKIASRHPTLSKEIAELDQVLAESDSTSVLRPNDLAFTLGFTNPQILAIFEELVAMGDLTEEEVYRCKESGYSFTRAEYLQLRNDGDHLCSSCGRSANADHFDLETIYHPAWEMPLVDLTQPNLESQPPAVRTILVLSANPKQTKRLEEDDEVRAIQEIMGREAIFRDRYNVVLSPAARIDDLKNRLLEKKPAIVHFCGHGAGSDGLVFVGKNKKPQKVTSKSLAGLFGFFHATVECVILNACLSDHQADAISKHIKFVVGICGTIDDSVAVAWATEYYRALGAGQSYLDAHKFVLDTAALNDLPEKQLPKAWVNGKPI